MGEWREVTGGTIDVKKQPVGAEYVGEYKGVKEIETQLGKQFIYKFENEEGEPFQMYGFTALNFKMESVPINTVVKITYKGTAKKKTKFGIKDVHQCSVSVRSDGEETTEVPF